ncbi:hypothetical protein [Yoonia sp. BS5-3]|uniref:VCBS repeat-containing protein n=1 Tax=Yoonia phaeophyticola TaxID=3137369 RepID=A0ABZ2V3K2_9RHOB
MHIRIALICAMIHTAAAAETISTLTLDWNEDGFDDIARLDHSSTIDGRADLLLFEGSAGGQVLVQVAADFARAPIHPNIELLLFAGTAANRLEIVETGTVVGPDLWWSKTQLRYVDDGFVVDAKETQQTPALFSEAGMTRCFVDFRDKSIGGGNDIVGDVTTTDAEPMPLGFWTASTFENLMGDVVYSGCSVDPYLYDDPDRPDGYFLQELSLDWNGDGYLDHVALSETYTDYQLAVFLGDANGGARLTSVGSNLRPFDPQRFELRKPPGRASAVELTLFGSSNTESRFRNDVMTRFVWQEDEPVVAGFAVWQTHKETETGIDCVWDFQRGRQINVYSDAWFDDPKYDAPYTFGDWQNLSLSDLIGACRP